MSDARPSLDDRLAVCRRPDGWPVMHQSWGKLLFIHWRVEPATLRELVPRPLEIDTFDGDAFVAITPFTLWDVRPVLTLPLPFLSSFHEINVRTYVHLDGVPGVWFFSLDANSLLAVTGARVFYALPYHDAVILLDESGDRIDFSHHRSDGGGRFECRWTVDRQEAFTAEPGSLEFFLTERYCLYAESSGDLYRCRIHHQPWPLRPATLVSHSGNLLEVNRIPQPATPPMPLSGGTVNVEVWAPEKVRAA